MGSSCHCSGARWGAGASWILARHGIIAATISMGDGLPLPATACTGGWDEDTY